MELIQAVQDLFNGAPGASAFAVSLLSVVSLVLGFATGLVQRNARPLRTLKKVIDLVPTPPLRKRLGKLLADQAHHASYLRKAGRRRAALWIECSTWLLVAWYVAAAPIQAVWTAAIKRTSAPSE